MSLSSVYIAPELATFAKSIGVSPINLAQAIAESDFTYLSHDELDRLKASCTAKPTRRPDPMRALTQV